MSQEVQLVPSANSLICGYVSRAKREARPCMKVEGVKDPRTGIVLRFLSCFFKNFKSKEGGEERKLCLLCYATAKLENAQYGLRRATHQCANLWCDNSVERSRRGDWWNKFCRTCFLQANPEIMENVARSRALRSHQCQAFGPDGQPCREEAYRRFCAGHMAMLGSWDGYADIQLQPAPGSSLINPTYTCVSCVVNDAIQGTPFCFGCASLVNSAIAKKGGAIINFADLSPAEQRRLEQMIKDTASLGEAAGKMMICPNPTNSEVCLRSKQALDRVCGHCWLDAQFEELGFEELMMRMINRKLILHPDAVNWLCKRRLMDRESAIEMRDMVASMGETWEQVNAARAAEEVEKAKQQLIEVEAPRLRRRPSKDDQAIKATEADRETIASVARESREAGKGFNKPFEKALRSGKEKEDVDDARDAARDAADHDNAAQANGKPPASAFVPPAPAKHSLSHNPFAAKLGPQSEPPKPAPSNNGKANGSSKPYSWSYEPSLADVEYAKLLREAQGKCDITQRALNERMENEAQADAALKAAEDAEKALAEVKALPIAQKPVIKAKLEDLLKKHGPGDSLIAAIKVEYGEALAEYHPKTHGQADLVFAIAGERTVFQLRQIKRSSHTEAPADGGATKMARNQGQARRSRARA